MNEKAQLTSEMWTIFPRFIRRYSKRVATQNESLLQNGICFGVAADKTRENANDHNSEFKIAPFQSFFVLLNTFYLKLAAQYGYIKTRKTC